MRACKPCFSLLQFILLHSLKQVLLPEQSFQICGRQILLHHAFAVTISEMNLLYLLHNQIVAYCLKADDGKEQSVASGIFMIIFDRPFVNVIRH